MKIAIMQPYYYPYIGYFDLIKAVDKFVFLNNVQYIRRGWVNRNRIPWCNEIGWKYITVPIVKCSQSTLIQEIKISGKDWKKDHLTSLSLIYKNSCAHAAFKFLDSIETDNLCELLTQTVRHTAHLLNINTEFLDSRDFPSANRKQYLLIDICKQIGADHYMNASGGVSLYDNSDFKKEGIELEFMPATKYPNTFSILDIILGNNQPTPV